MTAVAFDTLKFARSLREKAKLSPEQAEGFADAIAEAIQGDLATKADIKALGASTQADTQALRASSEADICGVKADLRETELRLEAKIEASKAEIIKWMFGTIGGCVKRGRYDQTVLTPRKAARRLFKPHLSRSSRDHNEDRSRARRRPRRVSDQAAQIMFIF